LDPAGLFDTGSPAGRPANARGGGPLPAGAAAAVLIGGAAYGFAFGVWRAPLQGVFAAVKLPAVLLTVVAVSSAINTILAQLLGAKLSLAQVASAMLTAMGAAAALLGALSPVVLFFVLHAPAPDPAVIDLPAAHPATVRAMIVFWRLLLAHIAVIGMAGLVGNLRLYALLKRLTHSTRVARRTLAAWIAVAGFAGCEVAWLYSPFLCKPNFPPHVLTRTYFDGNFYEHCFRGVRSLCRDGRDRVQRSL
jgi:hypothetical protein